eukprot:1024305-Pyramimonas_sp.AAC.1
MAERTAAPAQVVPRARVARVAAASAHRLHPGELCVGLRGLSPDSAQGQTPGNRLEAPGGRGPSVAFARRVDECFLTFCHTCGAYATTDPRHLIAECSPSRKGLDNLARLRKKAFPLGVRAPPKRFRWRCGFVKSLLPARGS